MEKCPAATGGRIYFSWGARCKEALRQDAELGHAVSLGELRWGTEERLKRPGQAGQAKSLFIDDFQMISKDLQIVLIKSDV